MAFQMSAQLLDACVLAVLSKEDTYGYRLTSEIRTIVEVSESTMYPVLRRLQKDTSLETYDVPIQGRNRRYYHITPQGRTALERYREEWRDYKEKVDSILGNGGEDI